MKPTPLHAVWWDHNFTPVLKSVREIGKNEGNINNLNYGSDLKNNADPKNGAYNKNKDGLKNNHSVESC